MARSRMSRTQQKTLSLFDEADFAEGRVKPESTQSGHRGNPAQTKETIPEGLGWDLLEQMVDAQNMRTALKRVEQNKGAGGVDEMTVKQLRPFLLKHWPSLKEALLTGTYRPSPVLRVEIPKPTGGMRLLGIPMCLSYCTSIQCTFGF